MIRHKSYQWYAVRTRYKCEKFVAEALQQKGITAYVPLLKRRRQYVRKVKDVTLPLINCYAFVCINASEYLQVLETQHVVGYLKIGGQLIAIPNQEIALLKQVVGEQLDIKIEPKSWIAGDPVEIIGGSLTGIKGILAKRQGKNEFIVDLESIGFQMSMIIENQYLRPVLKSALNMV